MRKNKNSSHIVKNKIILFFSLFLFILMVFSCRSTKKNSEIVLSDNEVLEVPDIYDDLDGLPSQVPAFPDTIFYELPDGYVLKIFLSGDEFNHQVKTVDGFPLLLNNDGFYEFAITDDEDNPQLSGIIARNPEDRTDDDWHLLNSMND